MALKDLFGKKSSKPISSKNLEQLKEDMESSKLLEKKALDDNEFHPRVDFSDPANFAFYGSALKYYQDSLSNIQEQYPYDGSRAEKIGWRLSASYLDKYMYDNLYPRTVGHAVLGSNYSIGSNSNGYYATSQKEYILVKGGPNNNEHLITDKLDNVFEDANVYDTTYKQENNLKFGGNDGTTVEFWLKKDVFSTGNESSKQVLFDLWSNTAHGQADYGRFRIEIQPGVSGNENNIVVSLESGSSGANYVPLSSSITLSDNTWHHYAVSAKNSSSNLEFKLHVDGILKSTVLSGSTVGEITGSTQATIGALQTSVLGAGGVLGSAKLSGSIDDFRFWKKQRAPNEIGLNWRTNVHGGTNTDTDSGTELGFYYKFNEGTTGLSTLDAKVLDYSGRTSNGTWVGYSTNSRAQTSALELAGVVTEEEKDPIIYPTHPDVLSLKNRLESSGSIHDDQNNSYLFNSMPNWIVEEDDEDLKNLTQVMSQHFDEIYLQTQELTKIKNMTYPSGSETVYPFGKHLLRNLGLDAPELFVDATIRELSEDRTDKLVFEKKINDTKNLIYQNIYNNLDYLYKSKGTNKSINNLIRCFGVDEDLVKFNMYSHNATSKLDDNYTQRSVSKRYLDFNYTDRFEASIYQMTSSNSPDQRSFISGSIEDTRRAHTLEAEFIFPEKHDEKYNFFFESPFERVSLMGVNSAKHSSPGDHSYASDNYDLSLYAVRTGRNEPHAYFHLTSSKMGINMTSSIYSGVYDNEKWNLAVRVVPSSYPYAHFVSGSDNQGYKVELYGVNYNSDVLINEFEVNSTISNAFGEAYLTSSKRVYAGAKRTNNNGSVLYKSDALISSIMYWNNKLTNEEIRSHALDPTIFGTKDNTKGYRVGTSTDEVKTNSLLLNWQFDNVTTTDANGELTVEDFSSGSASSVADADTLNHPGLAVGFPASSTKAVNKEYMSVAKKNLPETLNGENLVKVLYGDDDYYSRDSSPQEYMFSVEKSMYHSVSEEMLRVFNTVKDFNNLIGEPVNKYRAKYKEMEKLRQEFFLNVRNEPDFEKFLEYYKWVDDSMLGIIKQFIPASADLVDGNLNVVESHILERNKYQHQYPALEIRTPEKGSPARGIGELRYPWSRGHAPVSQLQSRNCFWWNQRAEKSHTAISSSITPDRQDLFIAIRDARLEELNKAVFFAADNLRSLNENAKKIDYTKSETKFGSGAYLSIEPIGISLEKDCDDVLNPNEKIKYDFKVEKA
tara:strand:- start:123432 stop:127130 length:3699 start_codon:yes stop_codon:yes gene_type:complete